MKTYTLTELKEAWKRYETDQVLRVLINGKWENRPATDVSKNINATRAVLRDVSAVIDFPEFLESMWKKA